MAEKYNKNIICRAKALRRNMTAEERHLWFDFLKNHPVHFYKQRVIGSYIVDFYCARANLVIELDGSQHYDEEGIKKDSERTRFLENSGLTVIRIPNNEVKQNFTGVCEYIDALIDLSVSLAADNSP